MNNHESKALNPSDILMIDDYPDNLRVLTVILAEQGDRVKKVINDKSLQIYSLKLNN